MTPLDLRALAVLHALLEERNVTRAARRLGIAQPAASATLARLRRTFGDPLLVRGARGMVLTERGRGVLPRVARILADVDGLARAGAAFDPALAGFDVAIAAADYLQATLLAQAVERIGREAPGVRVSVRALTPATLADDLERGGLDLALVPRGNAPAHLRSSVVAEERFVCVAREGHPSLGGGLDLDAYCALEHVLVAPTRGDFRGQVDHALAELGRARRVAVAVPSFFTALAYVGRSDRLTTVPARLIQVLPAGLRAHEPPLAVPGFTLAAVWHERVDAAPAHRWLRHLVASAA